MSMVDSARTMISPQRLKKVVLTLTVLVLWEAPNASSFSPPSRKFHGQQLRPSERATCNVAAVLSGIHFNRQMKTMLKETVFSKSDAKENNRDTYNVPLDECTISELWEIVHESNLMQKGLKSRLVRKQDIIDFLQQGEERHLHGTDQALSMTNEVPTTNEQQTTTPPAVTTDDGNVRDDKPKPVSVAFDIAPLVQENMVHHGLTSLLPIQAKAYSAIYSGTDVVLQAPTGSGKTLAYVLPLLSKLSTTTPSPRRTQQHPKREQRASMAAPQILVIIPSRELARQVGKEFDAFAKARTGSSNSSSSVKVATVHGGVPVERHVSLLRPPNPRLSPRILVGTPGRIRELHREGHFEYGQVSTVVIDEADVLLDKVDSPDVQAILSDLEQALDDTLEYQLVLVSATMNHHVVDFAREMEIAPSAMIQVRGSDTTPILMRLERPAIPSAMESTIVQQPIRHWSMSTKASARPKVAMDLISILSPLMTIVFVASKAEAESVAGSFSTKLGGMMIVRVLHGDLVQSARSRTIALMKEVAMNGRGCQQILVATDVASRGIDLPVDLVIQFGVPRQSGKDGTYSKDLYTHRVGRTGRVRSELLSTKCNPDNLQLNNGSNAILLYDPEQGEGKLISPLREDIYRDLGIWIEPKPLPSSLQVAEAAYDKTKSLIQLGNNDLSNQSHSLKGYFRSRLERELNHLKDDELLEYLARAMVQLSQHIDPDSSPLQLPTTSLLTASPGDRTVRVVKQMMGQQSQSLTPSEVTKACKLLGSGKLGKVIVCKDGSIVFDLPSKRAERLVEAASLNKGDNMLLIELPSSLPAI